MKNYFRTISLFGLIGITFILICSCSKKADSPVTEPKHTYIPEIVTDIDGNVYHTVMIGTQIWMVENLKTTKYNDGTPIPNVTNTTTWTTLSTGAYCDYDNVPANSTTYGRLYNWYVVDNNATTKVASNGGKNVCPVGWHVSTDSEWTKLTDYLGIPFYVGTKLKEKGTSHWITLLLDATNETGFTALPAGVRYDVGPFENIGRNTGWWCTTVASPNLVWNRYLDYLDNFMDIGCVDRRFGYSIRCIKD